MPSCSPLPHPTRHGALRALLLGAALALCSAPLLAQSPPAATATNPAAQRGQAQAAALRDFAQFVAHNTGQRTGTLPVGFPLDITDVQDLKQARIGHGFPVHTVDPKDLVAGRADLSAMARPSGIWRFIITLRDKPIGLATVEQLNGHWQTISYGASGLAQDVDALMAFHGNAERSNLRFIRVYQAQSDFLEVQDQGGTRFAPLLSARQSLLLQQRAAKAGQAGDGLMDAAEFIEPLRSAVKANLNAFR